MASLMKLPLMPNRRSMNPMDRADWFEAEGCLSSGSDGDLGSGSELIFSQAEKSPLECFATGCLESAVEARLYGRRGRTVLSMSSGFAGSTISHAK